MTRKSNAQIVVIGGGTGSFVVLSGLKNHFNNITALVSMADDGGSTGQLRDELGVLPPGDVRQCLVALARSPRVRDLFNYRFEEGSFKGHSFGNLFLTALEKMTGNFSEGVELASEILQVVGNVYPITLDSITLCMDDGSSVTRHERNIEDVTFSTLRPKIWLEPEPTPNPAALSAIQSADIIVITPGSLYESLGSALIVPGVGDTIKSSPAKKIYVCNLVTKPGQTDSFAVHDFAAEIERLAGTQFLDYIIYNTHQPNQDLLDRYAAEGELPVRVDQTAFTSAHYEPIGANLLADEIWENKSSNDPLASKRTLIRHDPDRLARTIAKLL